mmetsp:Transcript_31384/g.56277  ORF Transcript_31384/g.56277 Transcript_31384/m.56277 type:complete len:622 (+) Transcript_31384:139-2004(+)
MAAAADIVNCQFSVNQQALTTLVRPLLGEMLREFGFADRLHDVELWMGRIKEGFDLKADLAGIQAISQELHEQKQQIQQKASQATVVATQAHLRSLESALACKAEQSALDAAAKTVEDVHKFVASKADVASVNKALASMHKLQATVVADEKHLQDLAGKMQRLELSNLPQNALRMNEQMVKTREMLKRLQDALTTKADIDSLDGLCTAHNALESVVSSKVGPQTLSELRSAIRDLQLKVDLKADGSVMDEHRAELQRATQQLTEKAAQQELREAQASLHSVRAEMGSKVDLPAFGDVKQRLQALELSVTQKAGHSEMAELVAMRESISSKADRIHLLELTGAIERVQREAQHKAEAAARGLASTEVDAKLGKVSELERRMSSAIELLERKAAAAEAEEANSYVARSPKEAASPQGPSSLEMESKMADIRDALGQLDGCLQSVLQKLDSKADRAEIHAHSAAPQEGEQQRDYSEAFSAQIAKLEGGLKAAIESLMQKADRAEIEELLSSAAEAAAAEVNEWGQKKIPEPVISIIPKVGVFLQSASQASTQLPDSIQDTRPKLPRAQSANPSSQGSLTALNSSSSPVTDALQRIPSKASSRGSSRSSSVTPTAYPYPAKGMRR